LVALVHADLAFDPEYARRIGLDLDSLFIARPDDGAMALEIVDCLVRSGAFDLVAVNSGCSQPTGRTQEGPSRVAGRQHATSTTRHPPVPAIRSPHQLQPVSSTSGRRSC
jgi:RecA/RadA recombinase